jgi:hypothetical protein
MSGKAKSGPLNPSALRRAKNQRAKSATALYPEVIFLRSADPPHVFAEYGTGKPAAGVHVHFLQPYTPGDPLYATTVGGTLQFAHSDDQEQEITAHLRQGNPEAAIRSATPSRAV